MKILLSAAALAGAILGGGIAIAQTPVPGAQAGIAQPAPPPGGPGRKMMRMDTNRDGVITRSEAIAAATAKFDRIDANKDGRIDATEHAAMKDRRGHGRHRGGPGMPPPPPPADNG